MTFRIVLTVWMVIQIISSLQAVGEERESLSYKTWVGISAINATWIYGVWKWL